jgi:hypothetical protein
MYVGFNEIFYYKAGTKPTTPAAALEQVRANRSQMFTTWVDDVRDDAVLVEGMQTLDLATSGYFFWAKDKSTILQGFAAREAPLVCQSQIAVFSGAYLGDTQAINRLQAFGAAAKFKSKFEEKRGKGSMTMAEARNVLKRRALDQKGFFVFVADNGNLGQTPSGVRIIPSGQQSLKSIRPFIE